MILTRMAFFQNRKTVNKVSEGGSGWGLQYFSFYRDHPDKKRNTITPALNISEVQFNQSYNQGLRYDNMHLLGVKIHFKNSPINLFWLIYTHKERALI